MVANPSPRGPRDMERRGTYTRLCTRHLSCGAVVQWQGWSVGRFKLFVPSPDGVRLALSARNDLAACQAAVKKASPRSPRLATYLNCKLVGSPA